MVMVSRARERERESVSASVTLYSSAAVAVGLSCRESCLKSITSARQSIVVVCRTVGPVIDDQWMDGWEVILLRDCRIS